MFLLVVEFVHKVIYLCKMANDNRSQQHPFDCVCTVFKLNKIVRFFSASPTQNDEASTYRRSRWSSNWRCSWWRTIGRPRRRSHNGALFSTVPHSPSSSRPPLPLCGRRRPSGSNPKFCTNPGRRAGRRPQSARTASPGPPRRWRRPDPCVCPGSAAGRRPTLWARRRSWTDVCGGTTCLGAETHLRTRVELRFNVRSDVLLQ